MLSRSQDGYSPIQLDVSLVLIHFRNNKDNVDGSTTARTVRFGRESKAWMNPDACFILVGAQFFGCRRSNRAGHNVFTKDYCSSGFGCYLDVCGVVGQPNGEHAHVKALQLGEATEAVTNHEKVRFILHQHFVDVQIVWIDVIEPRRIQYQQTVVEEYFRSITINSQAVLELHLHVIAACS